MPSESPEHELEPIDRIETGVRALKTVLFFVIVRVVELTLLVVVLFELLYVLVTGQDPAASVKRFAARVTDYLVEIVRYLTYIDDEAPFPFRDFPPEPELDAGNDEPAKLSD